MPDDLRLYFDPRPSVEHVVRIADGGGRTWHNEVAACRGCNSARGEISPTEFYRSAETLRGLAYRKVNRRFGAGWPVKLGELPMTPGRQEYFDLVWGPWRDQPDARK